MKTRPMRRRPLPEPVVEPPPTDVPSLAPPAPPIPLDPLLARLDLTRERVLAMAARYLPPEPPRPLTIIT